MARIQRKYTTEFKLETVLEGIRGEKSIAQLCRERDIKDSLYYKWRQDFLVQFIRASLLAYTLRRQTSVR